MYLALREMRRAKVRFGLLMVAIGLLVFLILFQQSIQQGLITSFIGAIRNQTAPVLVFSTDGQRVVQASTLGPDLQAAVEAVDGVAGIGRIGQGTFTVATGPGDGRRGQGGELAEASVWGYTDPALGGPGTVVKGRLPEGPGEAVATEVDASDGFDIGERVRVEPGGLVLSIVGLARDAQLSVTPTLYVSYDTYLDAVAARNPDAGEPPTNVLGVRPAPGLDPAELAARVNAASEGLDALTRAAAADRSPGVAQVQQSFQVIFVLYGLVVPLVTGLFFLIVTLQKASALTLLRAIGAPSGRLVGSLVAQVAFVIAAGLLLGVAAYAPISGVRIGGVPLRFETGAVLFWSTLLLVLGVASSLSSARRVWRIDPLAATTGAGVER